VKRDLEVEVQHSSGELNVLLISKQRTKSLPEVMAKLLKKEFSYPKHFSSLVLSMGDVDSRLAYDSKLMKEHAIDILYYLGYLFGLMSSNNTSSQ
jgi:hypothetical protein